MDVRDIILKITMATNISNNEYFRNETLFAHRHISFYILLSFENIFSLVANSLFLLSFIKAKNCTSNMYVIMRSLSVVDLVSAFGFIITLIHDLLVKEYKIQHELCRYPVVLKATLFLSNIFHLLLMGIDRYTAIATPHR